MAQVEKSIEIRAPLPDVFAYVADYRNALDWMVGFTEFRALNQRTFGLGAKVRASGRVVGFLVTTDLEIVDFVENERFTSESKGPVRSRTTWSFRSVPGGTLVTFSGEYRVHGLPMPILGDHILAHEVASHTTLSMRHLRRILEGRADGTHSGHVEPLRADSDAREDVR
jgi:uncharacterized membrane protein